MAPVGVSGSDGKKDPSVGDERVRPGKSPIAEINNSANDVLVKTKYLGDHFL